MQRKQGFRSAIAEMDVVLIVGEDNSGKSTLVRCLTGQGRGNHKHPAPLNIAKLNWGPQNVTLKTFCLISSLNEGVLYTIPRTQGGKSGSLRKENTIAPADLEVILDRYVGIGCTRAILCISATVSAPGWEMDDYLRLIVNGFIGQHQIASLIQLGAAIPGPPAVPSFVLPKASHPRNDIAATARLNIGLQ